jgi:hypothetical protein
MGKMRPHPRKKRNSMSNKESVGGEQAYQHTIEEAIEDEESRYQQFLRRLLSKVVERE